MSSATQNSTLILLGATGSLAIHRLVPALAQLGERLPAQILAAGRTKLTTQAYHSRQLRPDTISESDWELFLQRITYIHADHATAEGYTALAEACGAGDRTIYCAVPPQALGEVFQALIRAQLHQPELGQFRLVVEKPFGTSGEHAMELMQLLQRYHVPDDAVYALDHYLAKETVENLLTFRFGNALFRSIWSGEYIQEIQVTVAEETTVADRQNSYREIGVVRDMVQSHILQLIALVTMNEAAAWSPEAMATTKRERIASLRVDQKKVVLGQYRDAGVGTTPTYVATSLSIDDPSWKGVPILVRTGKALPQTVTDVTVRFKSGASSLLGSRLHGTQLTFRIQPDESIFMTMVVKQPGTTHELAHARMTFCYHDAFREVHPDTYVRVLDSVLCGKRTSCVDFATINALWDVVAALPIEGEPTIYEPGSWGPPEAAELVAHYKTDWTITTGDVCNGVTLMPYA